MMVKNGQSLDDAYMEDVLHVPAISKLNLFSFGVETDRGYSVILNNDGCQVRGSTGRIRLIWSRSAVDVYFVHVVIRRA